MKITFPYRKVLVANVNIRAEKRGEETEPAADVKLTFNSPNDFLSELSPSLKSSLYFYDEARSQGDMLREPGFLPHLKFPRLEMPIKWSDEMPSAIVALRLPGAEHPCVFLEACKVNDLRLDCKDGGTVEVTLRVQAHPSEGDFGRLASLVQTEVEVAIEQADLSIAEVQNQSVAGAAP